MRRIRAYCLGRIGLFSTKGKTVASAHLGESLRAYANVTPRIGILMRYPQIDALLWRLSDSGPGDGKLIPRNCAPACGSTVKPAKSDRQHRRQYRAARFV
jgi:hypothetical protein